MEFLLSLFAETVHAHVGYVVEDTVFDAQRGPHWGFLFDIGREGLLILLIAFVASLMLYALLAHTRVVVRYAARVAKRGNEYRDLAPWMLRLSVGIALMGAGTSGVLISPLVSEMAFSSIQIFLGFLLLAGLFTGPAAIATIVIYAIALSQDPYLLGNLELAASATAILLFGNAHPGVDDMLGISSMPTLPRLKRWALPVLRIGTGASMLFLAIYEKFLNPLAAAEVVREYGLASIVPVSANLWVLGAGIVELVLGICILVGLRTRLAAVLAFAALSLSFFFFNEAVYAHITLFGALSVLVALGGREKATGSEGRIGSR